MMQAVNLAELMPVTTELPSIISSSVISVAAIQWLKKSKSPYLTFINQHSDRVNIVANLVAAFIAATGLHYTYDEHVGTLMLTGLTVTAIRHGIFETARSYAFNQIIYETMVRRKEADKAALQEGVVGGPGRPVTPVASPGTIASAKEDLPAKTMMPVMDSAIINKPKKRRPKKKARRS